MTTTRVFTKRHTILGRAIALIAVVLAVLITWYLIAFYVARSVLDDAIIHNNVVNARSILEAWPNMADGSLARLSTRLDRKAIVELMFEFGATPGIFVLTYLNKDSAVIELLDSDPHSLTILRQNSGWSPMHVAACNGNLVLIAEFAAANASLDCDFNGIKPLALAARNGHNDAVNQLLALGSARNVYIVSYLGLDTELRQWIINDPSKLDEPDVNQNTLLHWAVQGEQPSTIMCLLELGANTKLTNHALLTPADLARERGRDDLADLIESSEQPE